MMISSLGTAAAVGLASAGAPLYIGCYWDCARRTDCSKRDLPAFFCSGDRSDGNCDRGPDTPAGASPWAGGHEMTPQLCNAMCAGYKFFGVQWTTTYYAGEENPCFCGNDYGNQGGKAPESYCENTCTGDSSIKCGATTLNSIYAVNNSTTVHGSQPRCEREAKFSATYYFIVLCSLMSRITHWSSINNE